MSKSGETQGSYPTVKDFETHVANEYALTQIEAGYHVESGGILDTRDKTTTYYALVVPEDDYDEYLKQVQERDRQEWAEARAAGYVAGEMEHRSDLPWEDMVHHPFFAGGFATPLEALVASETKAIEAAQSAAT